MKQHLSNVAYGILDYVAYPVAMLLATPVVLRNLGVESYGVWSVMTAVVSAGSILAAGFGDANIKHVSQQRGAGNQESLIAAVRALLWLNLLLAALAGVVVLAVAPIVSRHIMPAMGAAQLDCLSCLRLCAGLIALRAMESVCISTQRAYERYGAAVRISIVARLLSLIVGAALTYAFHRVAIILVVTLAFNAASTAMQFRTLHRLLGVRMLRPGFDAATMRGMFRFGVYSWLLAASGIVFGQLDRLALGVWLGAAPLAAYALCTQVAQPIYGLVAAGLHFLFPYLANRTATQSPHDLRHAIGITTLVNVLTVAAASLALLTVAPWIFRLLGRHAFDASASQLLGPVVFSTALLGISVTPTYALFAFDRIRLVTIINVGGALLCLAGMFLLGRTYGMLGVAWARIGFGAASLLLYIPLLHALRKPRPVLAATALCEEL